MGPLYDKPLNPLLDDSGQIYSDAPIQRLWRPDSSSPECSGCREQRRHWPLGKRARAILLLVALSLGIGLVIWLFLLLLPPSKIPPFEPLAPTVPPSSFETTTPKPRKTTTKWRRVHHRPHHIFIHVTAPPTPITSSGTTSTTSATTTTTSELRTTPAKEQKKPVNASTMFAKMDLVNDVNGSREGWGEDQRVIAQMERIRGEGTIRQQPSTTTASITLLTSPVTTTVLPPTTMTTTKRALTTTSTFEADREFDEERSEGNPDEENDEEDLFWMRDLNKRPLAAPTQHLITEPQPQQSSTTSAPSAISGQLIDLYDVKRPTIQFGPMKAKEMATEMAKEREKEEQVRQELNEIIASVERDNWDNSGGMEMEPDVSPVEIPFDRAGIADIPVPEPVWRRPPPDEATPPPPPPPLQKAPLALQPVIDKTKNEEHSVPKLNKKRRDAPVMVTALLDIGRGKWQRFTRHFDQYLGYLANILLRLQNHMIIYCDPSVTAYLRGLGDRIGWERLQIVELSLNELPFYRYRQEIESIMRWEQSHWHSEWDAQMRAHPETIYPDYDILVNSKPYLLFNATKISQFPAPLNKSEPFFVWLDAGYGHGSTAAIPHGIWNPVELKARKITLVQLTSKMERVERYTLDKVYRKQKSVVSGGFLAGTPDAIQRFWTFFHKSFMEMLDEKMVDDDQTTLLVTIQNFRSTFNLLHGGWFDAFKLLPSQ